MRTVVFGKKMEHYYKVDSKRQDIRKNDGTYETIFTGKPELFKESKIIGWEEILSYEGTPRYNNAFDVLSSFTHKMNISEDEAVSASEEIFRADLNEVHVHTDKVMSKIDWYKEESERDYTELIKLFNNQMIESNDKMKAYCDLHKLSYEETDCIELFNMVYPDNSWEIKDGKMQAAKFTITGGSLCGGTICGTAIGTHDEPIISAYGLAKAQGCVHTATSLGYK